MKYKKIVGWTILTAVFVGIICLMSIATGLKVAAIIGAASLILTAVIVGAVNLTVS